ncbi:hypothetical protein SO802_021828 [Lithocarpus litseifolius]|uniref:PRISE-like Rossmann-fold domain-containing protein n=1 Tax=Lithocarpus litseifolius TaxID=425828 RepID=A0AAW2CIC5_9ROSI
MDSLWRSSPPQANLFPSILDHYITFDALNYDDTLKQLSPMAHKVTHVFWVAIQVRENEESNIAANSTMLDNVIKVLKSATTSRLCDHVTLQTGSKHYIGPIFDPILGSEVMNHEAPFQEDMPRLSYPNFYYALEDLLASYSPSLTYSEHRSSTIIGVSSRSFYNIFLTLFVYATICHYEGLPFRYPGTKYTWEHFCDVSDACVLAEQQIWAAVTDGAKNQAFNCTNGDVFTWKSLWKVLCEVFDFGFVPFDENEKFDWVGMMKDKERVWDEIVENYGLCKTNMEEIVSVEAVDAICILVFNLLVA